METLKVWLPAVAGMLCLGLGAGLIGIYGFFVKPVTEEFGVGATLINLGAVALLLVPGIVSPFVGRLADRVSSRYMVVVGVTIAVASLLLISVSPSLALMGLAFVLFSLGLTFYGPVVVNGLMVKRYPGSEARALAIVAIGISISSATLPLLMSFLLSSMPWRTALAILGVGVWLVIIATAMLFIPSETGGGISRQKEKLDAGIYRRREFWWIGLAIAMGLSVAVIMAVVYPPLFLERGFDLVEVGWLMSLAGLAGLTGKLSLAWFGDALRHQAKWLAAALLLCQILGYGVLLQGQGTASMAFAVILLGYGGGAFIPMHAYLNSRYFDASVISEVIGAQMPLFLPFGPVGIVLAGYVYDRTGSYDIVLQGLAALLALAIVFALLLPRPQA